MPAAAPREDEREETLSDLLRETIDLAEAVADTVPEQRINANLNRILLAPLLLLDIDGVINVLHPTRPGYLSVNTNSGGSIHYRPDVLQRLVRLHNTGAVEIRWLTAWFGSAHDHLEPSLQLPCWPIEGRVAGTTTDWWKIATAQHVLAANPGRSLIWIDDDLDYAAEQDELDWLTNRALLISPSPRIGLTHDHLDQIERFIRS